MTRHERPRRRVRAVVHFVGRFFTRDDSRAYYTVWLGGVTGWFGSGIVQDAVDAGWVWLALATSVAAWIVIILLGNHAQRLVLRCHRDHDLMRLRVTAHLDELLRAVHDVNQQLNTDREHQRLQRAIRDLAASMTGRHS